MKEALSGLLTLPSALLVPAAIVVLWAVLGTFLLKVLRVFKDELPSSPGKRRYGAELALFAGIAFCPALLIEPVWGLAALNLFTAGRFTFLGAAMLVTGVGLPLAVIPVCHALCRRVRGWFRRALVIGAGAVVVSFAFLFVAVATDGGGDLSTVQTRCVEYAVLTLRQMLPALLAIVPWALFAAFLLEKLRVFSGNGASAEPEVRPTLTAERDNASVPAEPRSLPNAPGAKVALVLGVLSCLVPVGAAILPGIDIFLVLPLLNPPVVPVAGLVLGVAGAALGAFALRRISKSQGQLGGRSFATTGLIAGIISVVSCGLILAFCVSVAAESRRLSREYGKRPGVHELRR